MLVLPDPLPKGPCFLGSLALTDDPYGDPEGIMKVVVSDFAFVDQHQYVWSTSSGDKTNGASIPKLLWVLVGDPFQSDFLPAAALHDRYCTTKVRSWEDTDRMFLEAMLLNSTDHFKARIMYEAVCLFGPHW